MVLDVARGFDEADPYSRRDQAGRGPDLGVAPLSFRFGVPLATQLEFFGDGEYARLFDTAVAALEAMGGVKVPLDFSPFLDTAKLLYEGPWVAERYAAIEGFLRAKPDSLFPVTRQIIAQGQTPTAVDAFRAQYRLKALAAQAMRAWDHVDILVTPTAGTIYRITELLEDPIRLNSNLGRYTNFLNLLDLAAVAVPAGFRGDGMPFGITLVGMARSDHTLLALASRFHLAQGLPLGARLPALSGAGAVVPFPPSGRIDVAVCGAHLSGLPLNSQLTERGGQTGGEDPFRSDLPTVCAARRTSVSSRHGKGLRGWRSHRGRSVVCPCRTLRQLRGGHSVTAWHRQGGACRWPAGFRVRV